MKNFNKLMLVFVIIYFKSINCDRIKNKIYDQVYGNMCFRRLNGTHQTGCSSAGKSTGSIGVLHLIEDVADIDFLTTKPPPNPPYAAIIKPKHFTRENVIRLRDSEFISAIVLVNDTKEVTSFSQESSCPNELFHHSRQPKCDAKNPESLWNPFGNGLLQENFDIPIIFLSDEEETSKIIKCYNDFNREKSHGSLCAIEINSFMSAAGNSEICLRRTEQFKLLNQVSYCDPMRGKNIYGTLFPRFIVNPENRTNSSNENIILITARLDTTSGFDGIGLGAMDSLASVATLVTAAHFLRKLVDDQKERNVMFMLFNGESYDYIGSQRLLYDLKAGDQFPTPLSYTNPLSLKNIELMIDIGTLDGFDDLTFYQLEDSPMAGKFFDAMDRYNKKFGFKIQMTLNKTENIPPVSAQTFLRENSSFPAFVLANRAPKNKFYHSIFDNAVNLGYNYHNTSLDFDKVLDSNDNSFNSSTVQAKIRNIATVLALGVYEIVENKIYTDDKVANSVLVDEFLYCYLIATKCRLFQSFYDFSDVFQGNDIAPDRYVSVQKLLATEGTGWAHRTFGFVLSQKVPDLTKENCSTLPFLWIPGTNLSGECRLTTQNYSLALSPAFEDPSYDFTSRKYSTWTESTWNVLSARIFLRPSATHESFTFSLGLVFLVLSFVIVYIVNSKTDVLFAEVAAEHVSLPAQC